MRGLQEEAQHLGKLVFADVVGKIDRAEARARHRQASRVARASECDEGTTTMTYNTAQKQFDSQQQNTPPNVCQKAQADAAAAQYSQHMRQNRPDEGKTSETHPPRIELPRENRRHQIVGGDHFEQRTHILV